jgi:hypothetical protein
VEEFQKGPHRLRQHHFSGVRADARRLGLTRLRIIEIAVALLLTIAAIVFVGLTLWAAEVPAESASKAPLDAAVSY